MVDHDAAGDDESGDRSEGVRIIGAEEAAEAMERGDVASRRTEDQPKYGDRPARPPAGPRPALRFPLDASSDPTQIEKPGVRPPEPTSKPVSGPVEMPHWTEPATGEVPKVVIGDVDEADDLEAWSSFASSTPRWRNQDDLEWDDAGFEDPSGLAGEDTRIGALDTSDRPSDADLFSFDEIDEHQVGGGPEPEPEPEPQPQPAPRPRRSLFGRFSEPEAEPAPEPEHEFEDEVSEPAFVPLYDEDAQPDVVLFNEEPEPEPRPTGRRPRRSWRRALAEPAAPEPAAPEPAQSEPEAESYGPEPFDPEPMAPTTAGADNDDFYDLRDRPEPMLAPDPAALQDFDDELEQEFGPEPAPTRQRISSRNLPDEPGAFGAAAAGGGERNYGAAVAVAGALIGLALLASAAGPLALCILVAVILLFCAGEYFQAVRQAGYEPVAVVGLVAVASAPLAAYWRPGVGLYVVVVLGLLACLTTFVVGAGGNGRVLDSVSITLLGIVWIGLGGGFAGLLLSVDHGISLVWAAVIATVANDVGSLVAGRTLGTKSFSEVSPGKTIEGVVGGGVITLIATVLLVGVFPQLKPFDSVSHALLLGLVVAVVAPLGDLCQSALKRDLGRKDMGTLLPGHGGVFDRFDAMLFVLPATFFLASRLGILGL